MRPVSFALLALVPLVAACDKGKLPQEPPSAPQPLVRTDEEPAATSDEAALDKLIHAPLPPWSAVPALRGRAPAVTAWADDPRLPTLVIFSASWCPGCTASVLADRAIAKEFGTAVQVGLGLAESDGAFAGSAYATMLEGVAVWSEASTTRLHEPCRVVGIPSACLYANGEVLWSGSPGDAWAPLEALRDGSLAAWSAHHETSSDLVRARLRGDLSPVAIEAVLNATHGMPGWQNSIAWDLVDQERPSQRELALGVALSRDAVAMDGGIDFAHLDTYALALAKAGRMPDAAAVGRRVLEMCEAVAGKCDTEAERARGFIAMAEAATK